MSDDYRRLVDFLQGLVDLSNEDIKIMCQNNDMNTLFTRVNDVGHNMIMQAVFLDSIEAVERVLSIIQANHLDNLDNVLDNSSYKLCDVALEKENFEIMKLLMKTFPKRFHVEALLRSEHKLKFNQNKRFGGITKILVQCFEYLIEVSEQDDENGNFWELLTLSRSRKNILHLCVIYNNISVLEWVLDEVKKRKPGLLKTILAKTESSLWPPLAQCGLENSFIEYDKEFRSLNNTSRVTIAQVLIDYGADVNEDFELKDSNFSFCNCFLLILQCCEGNLTHNITSLLKVFIDNNVDLDRDFASSINLKVFFLETGLVELFEYCLKIQKEDFFLSSTFKKGTKTIIKSFISGLTKRLLTEKLKVRILSSLELMKDICLNSPKWSKTLELLNDSECPDNSFHHCVYFNQVLIAKYLFELLEEANPALLKKLINRPGTDNYSPFHMNARPQDLYEASDDKTRHESRIPMVELFLKHGVDIEAVVEGQTNTIQLTILGLSSFVDFDIESQFELSLYLLEKGANFEVMILPNMLLQDLVLQKGNFKLFIHACKLEKVLFSVSSSNISNKEMIYHLFKGYRANENFQRRGQNDHLIEIMNIFLEMSHQFEQSRDTLEFLTLSGKERNALHLCLEFDNFFAFEWILQTIEDNKPLLDKMLFPTTVNSFPVMIYTLMHDKYTTSVPESNKLEFFRLTLNLSRKIKSEAFFLGYIRLALDTSITRGSDKEFSPNKRAIAEYIVAQPEISSSSCKSQVDFIIEILNVPLILAFIREGKLDILNYQLNCEASSIDPGFVLTILERAQTFKLSFDSFVALFDAAVTFADEKGLDKNKLVSASSTAGHNILHLAVDYNFPEIIEWTHDNFDNFEEFANEQDGLGYTPLTACSILERHTALTRGSSRVDCARRLVHLGVDINQSLVLSGRRYNSLLLSVNSIASEASNGLSRFLIESGIEVKYDVGPNQSSLLMLLRKERYDLLALAISEGNIELEENDSNNFQEELIYMMLEMESNRRLANQQLEPEQNLHPNIELFLESLLEKSLESEKFSDNLQPLTLSYIAENAFIICANFNFPEYAEWLLANLKKHGKHDLIYRLLHQDVGGFGSVIIFSVWREYHIEAQQPFAKSRFRILKLFVEYGADIHSKYAVVGEVGKFWNGITFLVYDENPEGVDIETLEFLLENKVEVEPYDLILSLCFCCCNIDVLRLLEKYNQIRSFYIAGRSLYQGAVFETSRAHKNNQLLYKNTDPFESLEVFSKELFSQGFLPTAADLMVLIMWNQQRRGFQFLDWILDQYDWSKDSTIGNLITVCTISPNAFSAYLMLASKGIKQSEACYIEICKNNPPHRFHSRYRGSVDGMKCDICTSDILESQYLCCSGNCDYDICQKCVFLADAKGMLGFGAKQLARRSRKVKYSSCMSFEDHFPKYLDYQVSAEHELLQLMNAGIDKEELRQKLTKHKLRKLGIF